MTPDSQIWILFSTSDNCVSRYITIAWILQTITSILPTNRVNQDLSRLEFFSLNTARWSLCYGRLPIPIMLYDADHTLSTALMIIILLSYYVIFVAVTIRLKFPNVEKSNVIWWWWSTFIIIIVSRTCAVELSFLNSLKHDYIFFQFSLKMNLSRGVLSYIPICVIRKWFVQHVLKSKHLNPVSVYVISVIKYPHNIMMLYREKK